MRKFIYFLMTVAVFFSAQAQDRDVAKEKLDRVQRDMAGRLYWAIIHYKPEVDAEEFVLESARALVESHKFGGKMNTFLQNLSTIIYLSDEAVSGEVLLGPDLLEGLIAEKETVYLMLELLPEQTFSLEKHNIEKMLDQFYAKLGRDPAKVTYLSMRSLSKSIFDAFTPINERYWKEISKLDAPKPISDVHKFAIEFKIAVRRAIYESLIYMIEVKELQADQLAIIVKNLGEGEGEFKSILQKRLQSKLDFKIGDVNFYDLTVKEVHSALNQVISSVFLEVRPFEIRTKGQLPLESGPENSSDFEFLSRLLEVLKVVEKK